MEPLLHGMILAFGLILPLGVQNIFLFNQGATHTRFIGALPAIITASICDSLLIYLAVAGVSVVVFTFEWVKAMLFVVGFFFLVYMGWAMWKSADKEGNRQEQVPFSPLRQIAFAASVSLLNPHAILDTIGVIGTSSLAYTGEDKIIFTVACISVSWIWFCLLVIVGRRLGQIGHQGKLIKRVNQLSAMIIWAMALYLGINLINS
ncbi:amino acid transporter [Cytobacillus oceanisediminis]|uniref:Amino acid transporter n=1 Tax=Niallia alba TaxID=2729105 RepID=A0A7Y0KCX4_9BACI|nr:MULTISPECIES: LysE/ArgO family amino acid transporter [Bacillaceae]MBZ9533783.1 amino acid transporter [Cytobacillus oceanisediminis]NMO79960.1 amino acid transporter [Niallia alba]